jgi:acetyltransferase-like isoleucine patch superfamily enzyme
VIRPGAAVIDPTAQIASTAAVASAFRPLLDGRHTQVDRDTVIGPGVWIGQFALIGQGATIGANSLVEDYVDIQAGSVIGERVVVAVRSHVGIGANVGDDSVIKGHICDSARIGARCRIAGDLIHRQLDPSRPWDDEDSEEPAPVVADGAFVGWRALIVGGVNIGPASYVCAGALVTRDVPAGHIASGRNQITHPDMWTGALGKSPFFRNGGVPADAEGGSDASYC